MLRYIPNRLLGVSEPNPAWFGNPANDESNPNWTNKNWLKSRFHFSFAEYNNPRNTNFGVLRVMNDDLVQPSRGFGEHPHSNVEICTYVVNGFLTHMDSIGTEETLDRGSIQFMTAGRGVRHQEHNLNDHIPLRFIQIWITTRQQGLKPNYGSGSCLLESRLNKWAHLVSDTQSSVETPIKINQDANIFVTELEPGASVTMPIRKGRQAYILCMEGSASIMLNNSPESCIMERHDAAELYGETEVTVTARPPPEVETGESGEKPHLLLVEMEFTGKGRTDL